MSRGYRTGFTRKKIASACVSLKPQRQRLSGVRLQPEKERD
jgi:uncharacterized membrane protein YqjE